ncbi:MAG: hypothetical protein AAES65_01680 [Candidatus Thiodiazotropha sp. (ex. Lucinoma kazani)]
MRFKNPHHLGTYKVLITAVLTQALAGKTVIVSSLLFHRIGNGSCHIYYI